MLVKLLTTRAKRAVTDSLTFTLPKVRVRVAQGVLKGVLEKLPDGRKFQRFSGVPYAQTPIGDLRFKAPRKLEKFEKDEIDCTREGDKCFHKDPVWNIYTGSENGLNLNLYAPADIDSSKKLPVMVYIHGGGFTFDSNRRDFYSPEFLLMEDVIVVTMNYRLNLLGFLSLPSMGINGNAGLKDQQLALEWVYENISNFHGDKDNITLFGESGGSTSAQLHSLNDRSRKCINKLILQSGTVLNDWVLQRDAVDKTRRLAMKLGAKSDSDRDCFEALMKSSPRDMYRFVSKIIDPDERRRGMPMIYKPMVEKESEDAFLTQLPIDIIKQNEGKFNIPMIMGINNGDGSLQVQAFRNKLHLYADDMIKMIPISLNVESDSEEAKHLANRIEKFYYGNQGLNPRTVPMFVVQNTDFHWYLPLRLTNELYIKHQPECKQYVYEFCLVSRLNQFKKLLKMEDKFPGAGHFDDTAYLFDQKLVGMKFREDSREWKLRYMMCKMWTNFAKYGDPTPDHENPFDFKWTPVKNVDRDPEKTPIDYLKIDNDEISMQTDMYKERTKFWKELYQKYNGSFHNPKYPVKFY